MDTLMHDLYYRQYDEWLNANGAQDVGMLTEFMRDWNRDVSRWADSVFKTVASESDHNKALMKGWVETWRGQTAEAMAPLAQELCGGSASLDDALAALDKRLKKIGLA